MRFTSFFAAAAIAAGIAKAAPYMPFPLSDGFPSPNPAQLAEIESTAGGSIPNGPLPTALKPAGVTTLQLIALNEIFEVAYFNDLLTNITTGVSGYDVAALGYNESYVIETFTTIRAQEELHAAGANGILQSAGAPTISGCEYMFPVTDFESAIVLAATFTDIVLGVLPQAQTTFANDAGQETSLISLIGSIIAQEGEQVGFYRYVQEKVPSAAPFLTGEAPQFAFTALQMFIVPGSCPAAINAIGTVGGVATFQPLTVESKPGPVNCTVTYSVPGSVDAGSNSLVYLSGQNLPLTVPIGNVRSVNGMTYFDADFPFQAAVGQFAKGLTIAAVVEGTGSFMNSSAVAAATMYGPGLIEV